MFNWNYQSFKSYREIAAYEKWDIPHSQDHNTSLYWKWFMAQFGNELAKEYNALCPDIPESWIQITWEEAKESLDESNLNCGFDAEDARGVKSRRLPSDSSDSSCEIFPETRGYPLIL